MKTHLLAILLGIMSQPLCFNNYYLLADISLDLIRSALLEWIKLL